MENASKALLYAAEVIIALMIITLGVHLYSSFRFLPENYDEKMINTEIMNYNINFLKFDNRENITIKEIISLVNFAKENKVDNTAITQIFISPSLDNLSTKGASDLKEYIIEDIEKEHTSGNTAHYKVKTLDYSSVTGKVSKIIFEET